MLKLSDNLDLPLDFITERIAFLARTGAGKSGGMRVMFEQMFDAGQFGIFIDPKGDAWGIRAAGIGKGKTILVMGGDHGDVPLEATAGKVIAEFLVHERVSTVLDISDFGKADMVRFVTDLCQTLYRRNRDVVHVFIDEADMVAGEKFYDPRCLEAIQLIQNKGRHRGFGVTVATQRSAMINKSVLFASGTLVAMQTTAPRDIKTVKEWLDVAGTPEATKEIVAALPQLKTREALVYSPQLLGADPVRITFAEFQTFDSMRTPKPGETRQQPKSVADIDLSAVQRDMAATIEKVKAEDPRTLKAEVAKLRRELEIAQKETPQAVTETIEVQVPVIPEELKRDLAQFVGDRIQEAQKELGKISGFLEVTYNNYWELVNNKYGNLPNSVTPPKAMSAAAAAGARSSVSIERPKQAPPQKPVRNMTENIPGDVQLNKTQQRILDALAFYESIGNSNPSLTQIGAVALIDPTGGHFSNTVGPLSSNGLVERGDGRMRLTDEGRKYASLIDAPSSLSDYHDVLCSRVRKMKSASGRTIDMLKAIVKLDGQSITTENLGREIGIDHTGGHFSNTIGPLSTAGLISRRDGLVTPTDVLFPEGLI